MRSVIKNENLKTASIFCAGLIIGATSLPLRFYKVRLATMKKVDAATLNRYDTSYIVTIQLKKFRLSDYIGNQEVD